MGLARRAAMPIAVAAALFCAPLAAQTRPSENNPKRLIEKADRLAWLYNWYLAGPLYAEAEKLFDQAGDSRNALYAKIGRLRSEWETMSFPEVSEYLATELDSPLVQNDPQLRLWILDAKGAVDLEVNVASARQVYEEARELARRLGDKAREARAGGELGIISFVTGEAGNSADLLAEALRASIELKDVERASSELALEANRILALPDGTKPDIDKVLEARERLVSSTAQLIRANHDRAEATNRQIDAVASYQLWEDGILLAGCLIIACLGAWLILKTTTRLYRQITEQNAELTKVSWQLLEKQEHLARRLSHELHDELGQSLTALKANFSRHAASSCVDPAWMNDCSSLLKESIRSAHEISLLLRPTILDDFGLDSALSWLCDRFEERNCIKVKYVSDFPHRMEPEPETHLFRIAQEALTNVVRHSESTEVIVMLLYQDDKVRLRITDNGVGLPAMLDATRPHFGLTGMRARARSLRGEMAVRSGSGQGTEIDVVFPWTVNEHEEKNPNLVSR